MLQLDEFCPWNGVASAAAAVVAYAACAPVVLGDAAIAAGSSVAIRLDSGLSSQPWWLLLRLLLSLGLVLLLLQLKIVFQSACR